MYPIETRVPKYRKVREYELLKNRVFVHTMHIL